MVAELYFSLVHATFNGGRAGWLGRAGQRNMAFAGKQARRRIKPDPACAGQIHLAPGVQIGEIDLGAAGAIQRLDVGFELNQVARHEARRQPTVAQQLHQQPAGIAAGAGGQRQRFFRRLNAGFHADQVLDVFADQLVQVNQKGVRAAFGQVDLFQISRHHGGDRIRHQIRRQFLLELGLIGEGELHRRRFQEVVKRVVHRHLDYQIHRDLELFGLFREHQTRLVIGKRVLLPVDEMVCRLDLERIGDDVGTAVRRRAQPDDLWPKIDQTVIGVVGHVIQRGVNGHGFVLDRLTG